MALTTQQVHDRTKLIDLGHAVHELTVARRELEQVTQDKSLSRSERDAALLEPTARLRLVVRFLDEVIATYSRPTRRVKYPKSALTMEINRRSEGELNTESCPNDSSGVID